MDTKKEKLERVLRRSVKQAEEELASSSSSSSSCCRKVFEAISLFITKWDDLVEEEKEETEENNEGKENPGKIQDMPRDYLRVTFCNMLSNLDPIEDADLVREHILSTLQSIGTTECITVYLEFLPAITRIHFRHDSYSDTRNDGKSKRIKKDIISCLKDVFDTEPNSLSQILKSFSSMLEETKSESGEQLLLSSDIFMFVIGLLPQVPETNLHIALHALIRYVDNASDARLAIDEMRKELALLEKTDISDMVSMAIAFDEAIQGTSKGDELFVEEYLAVVEELVDERKKKQLQSLSNTTINDIIKQQLLTFDFVMILLSKNKPPYRDRILSMISDGFLVESELLSDLCPSKLLELVDGGHNHITGTPGTSHPLDLSLRGRLLESLVDFSMAIVLTAPLPCPIKIETERLYSNVQSVILRVVFALPQEFQLKLISTALDITEKLMKVSQEKAYKNENRSEIEQMNRDRICLIIYSLLVSVACKKSEILMPFQSRLVNHLISDSLNAIQNHDTLETLCTIVTKLVCNDTRNGQIDLILTCRGLLFSPPIMVGTTISLSQIHENSIRRRIRGMVFANSIISHCDLDETSYITVCKMVSRILVSPDSNICMLDPRIGILGIKIIRCLREQEKRNSLTGKQLFNLMTHVLSNSRVVRYSDDSSIQFRTKPNTVLAYTEIPTFLAPSVSATKRRKCRKMIFSFNALLPTNESAFTQFSNWKESSSWIFELFDSYLAIGRTTNWNPHSWIFAGIEFPAVSSNIPITGNKQIKLLEWMRSDFMRIDGSHDTRSSLSVRMDKQFIELAKGMRKVSEREAVVDSISRFTLSMLLAISLSTAILCNTHDHFKVLLTEECGESRFEQKEEAFRLIHCQLVKIYDLKRRCQSMEHFFRNLGSSRSHVMLNRSKKRKRGKFNRPPSTEKTKVQVRAELAAVQLKETMKGLFCSVDFIPSEVLWICLIDSSHDTLIISSLDDPNNSGKTKVLSDIVDIKLNLIEHLAIGVASSSPINSSIALAVLKINPLILRQRIARCLRLASFLLLKLQSVQDTKINDASIDSLTKLTSEYLRLLRTILVSKIHHDQSSETNKDDFEYFFGLYLSVIGSKQPMNDAIQFKANNGTFTVNHFKILVSTFQVHIGCCHASIASQLMETLSIFAAKSEPSILHYMVDVHWNAIFMSKHAHFDDSKSGTVETPFALIKALSALHNSADVTAEESCTHESAVKLMTGRFHKSGERNQFLIHSLCRHWGLIALSPVRTTLFTDFLKTLLGKLLDYLKGVDHCSVGQKLGSRNNEELSDDDDEDGEYIPPSTTSQFSKPSIPALSDFTCLTSSSYPIYFDMILRMTVSSIDIFSVPDIMSSFKKSAVASMRLHPIFKLERVVEVFGTLIKLYKDKFQIFPKFLLPSIIYTSKCMLDISVTKVQDYVEWRNSQPVLPPEDNNPGTFDMASTSFLKNLLDIFGLHVVGRLRALCYVYSESAERQGEGKISVNKHQQLFFGNAAMPRVNSLSRKVERAYDFLSQTSSRYSTGDVRTKCVLQEGFLQSSDHSTTGEESSERRVGGEMLEAETVTGSFPAGKSSPHRSTLTTSIRDYELEDSDDEESFIDDESSSRSDEFGVSGNWGQNTTEDEYGSDHSRSIREIKMTK